MSKAEQLDKELQQRINEMAESVLRNKSINVSDIFENKYVVQVVETPKVILPSYDSKTILANFPFTEALCVCICPTCSCVTNRDELLRLLERRAITPILHAPYSSYPTEFFNDILRFPHMSYYEFDFFRFASLMSNSTGGLCPHCVEKRKKEFLALCKDSISRDMLHQCFAYLHPFIECDSDLLDAVCRALREGDEDMLFQLVLLAGEVNYLRTAQAYRSRALLTKESVGLISSDPRAAEIVGVSQDTELVQHLLSQNLGVSVPDQADVNRFLDIYEPYKEEIVSIVNSVVKESTADGKVSMSKLSVLLSELNGQVAELSKKPSYLLYRASLGFAKTNKALIAGVLAAGALGIMGNLPGCGVSLVSGVGAHFWGKKSRNEIPPEAKTLASDVRRRLRKPVQKVLAHYLDVDVRSVQICEIKKALKDGEI